MSSTLESYLFQEELYTIPSSLVVVVSKPWDKYSSDEKTLLTKILGSVKIDPAAVRVFSSPNFTFPMLTSDRPSKVLIFGSEAENIPLYQATQAQGFTVVRADDLTQLDDARKKSLWVALKQMFSL